MRSRIFRLFDLLSNRKWDLIFYKRILFDKEFRRTMRSNKKLRNLHKGKRCFIVGNGSSLNKMDLTKISNEMVFTVNYIMANHELYQTLNSDYHIIIDPNFLSLNPDTHPEDVESINRLRRINYENKKPVCIIREDAKKPFDKYGVSKILDIHYIFQHINFSDNYSAEIDLSKNMPTSQNVIQAAIFSAIYMGFSKIYLIGVDMTSIFFAFESDEDGNPVVLKDSYAYKFSEKELKNVTTKKRFYYDNEFMMNDYAKTFRIYKMIRKYAERKNIEIYNATKGGGLDVFERVRYESLFS